LELVWSDVSESYAGGSVATGRVYHARQIKGDDTDKRDSLVFQVGNWAWGWQYHPIKICTVEKLQKLETALNTAGL
jgi:hypothetical protein